MDETSAQKDTQALCRKKRLKKLLDKGLEIENNLDGQQTANTLADIRSLLNTADGIVDEGSIEDRAGRGTEVVIDAQVLKMTHELVSKMVIQTSKYNDKMYINAINRIIEADFYCDWGKITQRACKIAHSLRVKSTMLGAIDTEIAARTLKERQRRKRIKVKEEKKPESVKQMKRKDAGVQKMKIMYEHLEQIFISNNRQPIPFYKLVIDPQNFMKSVENIFQMAFLARENKIAIHTGEDGYPHVQLAYISNSTPSQSICSLNTKVWKEMIDFYEIKGPMLQIPVNIDDDD